MKITVRDDGFVEAVTYDVSLLLPEELERSFDVEEIPVSPLVQEGKYPVLYYDMNTLSLYYKEVNCESRPKTLEEQIVYLQQQLNDMSIAMAQILGGA